jgi:putative 4-mercaptohistidine N1-methyltranferase
MDFHFGPSYFDVANFSKTIADICLTLPGEKQRALDIGCAVGRASFELSIKYKEVVGIDFSARFIQIAAKLQKSGKAKYKIPKEGDLVDYCQIDLNDLLGSESRGSVNFLQGDACNLSPKHGQFDLVLACNLIDRLAHPAKFVHDIDSFINPHGYLIIVSPYTWLTEFTDKENWLGGFKGKDGENVTTLSGLTNILAERYTLVESPQTVEFVIKETQRKFQHTFSELTIWQKKT